MNANKSFTRQEFILGTFVYSYYSQERQLKTTPLRYEDCVKIGVQTPNVENLKDQKSTRLTVSQIVNWKKIREIYG